MAEIEKITPETEVDAQALELLEEAFKPGNIERRDFLKGAALGALGMAPMAMLLGCSSGGANAKSDGLPKTGEGAGGWVDPASSDELMEKVLAEAEDVEDAILPDGTVIPAIFVRMRNHINRMGIGIGSIPNETSWQMIQYLWSEEDAENYMKMPVHRMFTTGDYKKATGWDEEKCQQILDDQANRCLIWRTTRGGLKHYALFPYINGFWEFNELLAHFSGKPGAVKEFDTQGIMGSDPNAESGHTFPLFRSYPVGPEVVEGGELDIYHDWRSLIKRNELITVSPCQCRTMWEALDVPYPKEHPHRTCLSLGDMAQYFIETGIGEQISQDEAIAIVEDIIAKGMVVESICTQNADIICCCHSESCGNLKAWRGRNGQGDEAKNYSLYDLEYDAEKCIKCGKCLDRCPMKSITFQDGICVMDDACVRCGQCVTICPADARILKEGTDYPTLPEDYLDTNRYFAKDRMARGQLVDFKGGKVDPAPAPKG